MTLHIVSTLIFLSLSALTVSHEIAAISCLSITFNTLKSLTQAAHKMELLQSTLQLEPSAMLETATVISAWI